MAEIGSAPGQTSPRLPGASGGTLLFLQTHGQFHALLEQHPELLRHACIVGLAAGLSLGQACELAGVAYRPYTDWLDAHGFAAVMAEAVSLSRSWFAEIVGSPGDPDLLECVRLEMLQGLSELLLAHRVAARALDELNPERVVLVQEADGGARTSAARVAGVIAHEAEARQIEVRWVRLASLPSAAAKGSRMRAGSYLRQAMRNAGLLAEHWIRQAVSRRPVLLSFGAGVDSINQQRLMPGLLTAGTVRPVLVRAGAIDATMRNRPGRGEYPVLQFLPLTSMLGWRRYLPQCWQWWAEFNTRQPGYEGAHHFLFGNRRLRPWFEQIFLHLLPHAMATRRDLDLLLRTLRPRLVLTSNEVSFPVRALVLAARRRAVPTLALIHSGLNNMLYRDLMSDRIAVWGDVHVRELMRVQSVERARLIPIGNPQYDTMDRDVSAGPHRFPRVLVVTAISHWHMAFYDMRQHLRAWRELQRLPQHGVQVTIKPHPRFDDYAFYQSLKPRLADWRVDQPGIAVPQAAFIEEVLPTCDLVVVPNLPTTAALEAMLFRKPVVYLRCGFEEVDFCTSIAPGCEVVTQVEQIVPVIMATLSDPERQVSLVRKGQAYLDEFLGARDGRASARLASLVADMVTRSEVSQ